MAQHHPVRGAEHGPCNDEGPFPAVPMATPHDTNASRQSIQPGRAGTAIGSVLGLMLQHRNTPPARTASRWTAVASTDGGMLAATVAHAVAGHGLDGDRHADPLSPRQILLAGAPAYRRHGLAAHTLRENVLLDVDTATLRSGTLLRLGEEVIVGLTFHCEACGYLDTRHPGIARVIGKDRGVLARVLQGGMLRPGAPVVRLPETLPPWSDDWRARVAHILAQVPEGMVVEYRQLARLAGVQAVYCRALPALARKLGLAQRAVAQAGSPEAMRWLGEHVFAPPREWAIC